MKKQMIRVLVTVLFLGVILSGCVGSKPIEGTSTGNTMTNGETTSTVMDQTSEREVETRGTEETEQIEVTEETVAKPTQVVTPETQPTSPTVPQPEPSMSTTAPTAENEWVGETDENSTGWN